MRRLLLTTIVLTLTLVPMTANAVGTYAGQLNGYGFTEPSPGQFEIQGLSALITCPAGETFFGRANAREDGAQIFIGKFRGTCTGSQQAIGTFRGESFGTVTCFDEWIARGQIRVSDDHVIRLRDKTFEINCLPFS